MYNVQVHLWRINSDQKYSEIKTDFDHFYEKFRPVENRPRDYFTTTVILYNNPSITKSPNNDLGNTH